MTTSRDNQLTAIVEQLTELAEIARQSGRAELPACPVIPRATYVALDWQPAQDARHSALIDEALSDEPAQLRGERRFLRHLTALICPPVECKLGLHEPLGPSAVDMHGPGSA